MFQEIKLEILLLSQDLPFIRNLSLTLVVAIACLFTLSDLQRQNNLGTEQVAITNLFYSSTQFTLKQQ